MCPGCGRSIVLPTKELILTIECIRCGTRFSPNENASVPRDHTTTEKAFLIPYSLRHSSGNKTGAPTASAQPAPDALNDARIQNASAATPDVYNVSPADLAAADVELRQCEREWRNAGSVVVQEEQVDRAMRSAQELQCQFEKAEVTSRQSVRLRYLTMVQRFDATGLPRYGMGPLIGYSSAGICAISLLLSPFIYSSAGSAIIGSLALAAVCSVLLSLMVLLFWPNQQKRHSFQWLQRNREELLERVEVLRSVLEKAWSHHEVLRRRFILSNKLRNAQQRYDNLVAIVQSAKYQLIRADWRSMRGLEFERFLSRVFEMLGYQASLTKASGDQGVDILVSGKGRRIAVQAKGYSDSVGVGAVQEVVAGKPVYQCDSCVVITNSHFTRAAHQLADANGCRLIGGEHMRDLIEGHIY
jgi:hypothetical protein